ncbi:MAG: hypothetical protein ICV74_07630 [Thermoleophilia bacterium]|nr:hypothetical protein [Thermoleophilia bacterium]
MNRGDELVERGAERLQELAREMAARGGVSEKLAHELAEDAAFLRKLKPSLIAARARGEVPTDGEPGPAAPLAPAGPQHGKRPKAPGSGPNPFLVVGAALAIGFLLAKVIDWRGHAHPKHD